MDDYSVRAIVIAFNKDYMEYRKELNLMKREIGFSSYKDTKFLYEYLKD